MLGEPLCVNCNRKNDEIIRLKARLKAVDEILRPYTDEEGSTLIADIRAAIKGDCDE